MSEASLPSTSKETVTPTHDNKKAWDLLEFGVMPLLPPMRRNWSGTRQILLKYNGVELQWPPTGWENLTSDKKLQAWECAALTLETGGNLDSLVSLDSRSNLLAKYNMLCLPGSSRPTMVSGTESSRKVRFYNYQRILEIIKAKERSSEDQQYLKMMEAASKCRSIETDSFVIQLQENNIPLKL